MLSNISPAETLKMMQDSKARLVDVREADELAALRVPGAEAAPLSVISWMDLRPATAELPIIFTCNSGNRTTKNSDLLQKLAAGPAWQMEGGVSAWAKQGLPVETSKQTLPIFRQIQIGAGGLVLAGLACVALMGTFACTILPEADFFHTVCSQKGTSDKLVALTLTMDRMRSLRRKCCKFYMNMA